MDRQKLLLIFGGAWVSAALLTWFLYSTTKAPKTDKTVSIVAAARDLPAGTRLKKADLKLVKAVEKDAPKTVVAEINSVLERPLLFPVNANEPITTGKIASVSGAEGIAATIEPGKRAVSVPITDSTGAGGLIQPRAHVDVLFTRSGSMAEAVTATVLEDIVVLSIGRSTEVQTGPADPRAPRPQNQAATLLVTPEQARKLEWARNQGKISLALRNPLDRTVAEENRPTTVFDVAAPVGIRGRRPAQYGNLRDNRYWAGLTGQDPEPAPAKPKKKEEPPPEPPKPKYVVDVYRGDKHVQEIFQ